MPIANNASGDTVSYRTIGTEGPWIVMIQGLGLSAKFWGTTPDDLPGRLGHPVRVLVPDNRGTGASHRPTKAFSMSDFAGDTVAAMDAAGIQSAVVCGISMGGMIAQHVALKYPDRVAALLLLATTPGLPRVRPPGFATLRKLSQMPKLVSSGKAREAYESLFFSTLPKEEAHRRSGILMELWGPLLATERADAAGQRLQLRAAMLHTTGNALRTIRVPTHVMAGTDDIVVPPVNSRTIAKLIPGATLEELPQVGHALPHDDRDAVARGVRLLLNRIAAGGTA